MTDAPRERAPVVTPRATRELDPTRRTIADRLTESWRQAPHVTVFRDVDAAALTAFAADLGEDSPASIVDVVLLAVAEAALAHPAFNATFEDGALTTVEEVNVAVAVDTDAGLLAPVVADVAGRDLEAVARDRRSLTERVRAGEQTMADLRGGTITVTNLGPLGVDAFTPVINPPQVAIVSLGRLRERVVLDAGEARAVPELPLGVTFDHRPVDGADAARFLDAIADALAEPEALVG
ncbi:MAG: 2-oxo acid dehydrogenase subunit E2 [Halobacteriales archaeon]